MPFFSVIIITYNRANLLERALNSLLAQTENDWEAIIIDDGSNDNTSATINPFLINDNRLHYHQFSRQGIAVSRNEGIKLSSGKFITFLDSDDEYKPDHLFSRKNILIENPELEFLHSGVSIVGNEYVPDFRNPNKLIHLSDCKIGGTFFIKREVITDLGGFPNQDYGGDAILYEMAEKNGIKIMEIGIKSYIYHRETVDSVCNTINGTNK